MLLVPVIDLVYWVDLHSFRDEKYDSSHRLEPSKNILRRLYSFIDFLRPF